MKRIDFLIAGAQKCGTTALWKYLRAHPRLEAPAQKELHFFDDEAQDWRRPDVGALHRRFADPEKKWFEATPITLFWPPALARVYAYRPDMRLLLLFRDPVARAWSHWRMEFSRGTETLGFADAVGAGRARLPAADQLDPAWRAFSYVERGFYGAQLARALELFPRAQMLLLDSADLARWPTPALRRVTDFLGVAPLGDAVAERVHPLPVPTRLPPPDAATLAALHELYRADLTRFASLSGLDAGAWSGAAATPS